MNKLLIALALLVFAPLGAAQYQQVPTPRISPQPVPESWKGSGKGSAFLLYRTHPIKAMHQGNAPSCVGAAAAKALELMGGKPYSAEWIYGSAREEFNFTVRAGANCAWAAHIIQHNGALPASAFAALGEDITDYSAVRANNWSRGPPTLLKPIAALYKSPGYIAVRSWDTLRGAISNGYPVIVGSSVGFGPTTGQSRDASGALRARWWSRWNHAMVFIGVSDGGRNEGALLLNSWGDNWVGGPKRFGDEPDGSFWASRRDVEKMLAQGDSFVILPIARN